MKAWGAGIATFSGDRILEVFYPEPQLGEPGKPHELPTCILFGATGLN